MESDRSRQSWSLHLRALLRVVAVSGTLVMIDLAFAQQNTPIPKDPPNIHTVPNMRDPVIDAEGTDECVSIANDDGLLEELRDRAFSRVPKRFGARQSFIQHIPDDRVAQCKYYNRVIRIYSQ